MYLFASVEYQTTTKYNCFTQQSLVIVLGLQIIWVALLTRARLGWARPCAYSQLEGQLRLGWVVHDGVTHVWQLASYHLGQ